MEELIGSDTLVLLHSEAKHPVFLLSLRKSCIHLLSEILYYRHPSFLFLYTGSSEFQIKIGKVVSKDYEE